ncbi:uncharacterized protein NFIA_069990 [Aspergillus fischeri NRRL 181]|uniref:Uncharacterized protein n=1 Tax=Neosartorya fischeri (strain ATCC 1020 / DSM 3700 / CBS 544.65 / FGSC A1164 / JCM 1740 / NRRL 181 / WB 181) TaxID=331117 RepID=A1D7Y4_NEOFI|nr:conserved hypothetical protein [Aspergillus fischeri NRRL 181]EAW21828.1 conserved hypothetical protein [Aspergillus fischeri NRRL 181]KAG2024676.1 hypothetical protein GB937_003373 [Aspergillus fischeri]
MEPSKSVSIDEAQYRNEVLLLPSEEVEIARDKQLVDEAHELGLKVPEVEVTASVAASIASGIIDLSSPVLSASSSTDRNSICEVTHSFENPRLDQVASSLSELTVSSDPMKCGSPRSIASLSTRPTSLCSSEGRLVTGLDGIFAGQPGHRNSLLSLSSTDKKEKRKSSLKSAIGRIHFRKKRTSSTVLLPPAAQITVARGQGGVDRIYVESRRSESQNPSSDEESQALKVEIPIYDKETLQRSLENEELAQLRELHKSERDRHAAFQDSFLMQLRRNQQVAVADRLSENKALEEQKRAKNEADAARMEERQLAVEMDQLREFEREKQNSRTRIKYMEGYFNNAHPPPISDSESNSGSDQTTPVRQYTNQQKSLLAQEYHDHECMDRLHSAKIKVLRDRQEIRLQEAIARMERELDALIDKHALEFAELQRQHQQEEALAMHAFETKKTKLRHRWNLEEAILRKKLELQHGHPYGPLPPLSFSDSHYETRDSAICVSENSTNMSGDEQTHPKEGEESEPVH